MKIESPAFGENAHIPEPYSAYGENKNPPLVFRDVPSTAQSLAVVVEDPDASRGTFTHWIVFDLDPHTPGLPEACQIRDAREGRNDQKKLGYLGPRPPSGEHRYFFRLYALDRRVGLRNEISRAEFDHAITGHVIAKAHLMGRFATPLQAERDGL